MTDFLHYWKPTTARSEILGHAAGEQLGRVQVGDNLWIITMEQGRLWLIGRLPVGRLLTQEEAEEHFQDSNLWQATYHVLAPEGAEGPLVDADIHALAHHLRFEGKNDRLPARFSGQHFQAMRRLTPKTVRLLEQELERRAARMPAAGTADDEDEREFREGRPAYRLHRSFERNRALIQAKKRQVTKETGRLACEVCDFEFALRYGKIGRGFIEAHHTKPLAELKKSRKTRLRDLALVCSNCHRMLHRRRPWLGHKDLRSLLKKGDPARG